MRISDWSSDVCSSDLCCHAVLPHMLAQKSGAIVNVGSVATRGIFRVPYSAAKGGVAAITTALAMEVAEFGLRVNCVAPGGVDAGQIGRASCRERVCQYV